MLEGNMRRLLRNCRVISSANSYLLRSGEYMSTIPRFRKNYCLRSSFLLADALDEETKRSVDILKYAAFLLAFGCGSSFASLAISEPVESGAGPLDNESDSEKVIDVEAVMENAERGIQERLKSHRLSASVVSPYTISAKGQQVSIKFPVSPLCDLWYLVVDLVANIGKLEDNTSGGKIVVSASSSLVAQVMTLEHPNYKIQQYMAGEGGQDISSNALCIDIFEPMMGEKFPEIEFLKKGAYSDKELDFIINALRIASVETPKTGPRANYKKQHEVKKKGGNKSKALESLEAMGVKVYGQDNISGQIDQDVVSWDNIAGYHEQKREIEDTILLALRCPEVYDNIARGTRRKFESNRPRAILFEGPPGTGKTSSARVIASEAGVPLLYVPLEAVMSKYYGESEKMLGKVFNTANNLQDGAIIFLDEIDSLATTRDNDMHEATRRMLSVLLRQIDGFEQENRVVVIAATNRKEDLDPALISRFDSSITFDLPDQQTREEITAQYARHLTPNELAAVAAASEGMSGRDLRDICQQAERRWASKVIRNHGRNPMGHELPPPEEYLECVKKRRAALLVKPPEQGRRAMPGRGRWPPSVVV